MLRAMLDDAAPKPERPARRLLRKNRGDERLCCALTRAFVATLSNIATRRYDYDTIRHY